MPTQGSLTEPESIATDPDTIEFSCYTNKTDAKLRDDDLCAKTLQAIEQITSSDTNLLHDNEDARSAIQGAADVIIYFLDRVCLHPNEVPSAIVLYLFPRIANVAFLCTLFCHRRACYSDAVTITASKATTVVVCWVDVVLAKFAALVTTLSAGLSTRPFVVDEDFLKFGRESDHVYAVTQLPERWEGMIEVLGSSTASPAAIRVAVRLLFAILIMEPQLTGRKEWVLPNVPPQCLMSAVLRNVGRKSLNGLCFSHTCLEYDDEQRATFAMLVVIFSASHMVHEQDLGRATHSTTKIQSLTCILDTLQTAFYSDAETCGQKTLPYTILDTAQAVLIKWGNLVPWSWSTWADQRMANVECIVDLRLLDRIMIHMRATRQAANETFADLAVVLQKTCCLTTQMLHYNERGQNSTCYEPAVPSFCQSLEGIFCCLGDREDDLESVYLLLITHPSIDGVKNKVKDHILECLCLISAEIVASSFRLLREDKRFQVDSKVNEEVNRCIEKMEFLKNPDFPNSVAICLDVQCTLCFLALIGRDALDNYVYDPSFSLLISKSVDLLASYGGQKIIHPPLENVIYTFISLSERFIDPTDQDMVDDAWALALQTKRTNLSIASAFSHRTLLSRQQGSDPLTLAEAWSYLCSVLLVILSGNQTQDEEALALLISPGICIALAKLAETTTSANTGYRFALRRQLQGPGRTLCGQTSDDTTGVRWHLAFYYAQSGSQLRNGKMPGIEQYLLLDLSTDTKNPSVLVLSRWKKCAALVPDVVTSFLYLPGPVNDKAWAALIPLFAQRHSRLKGAGYLYFFLFISPMSSLRHMNHRRRSHPESKSSPSSHTQHKARRVVSTKRSRAQHPSAKDAFSPPKWDADYSIRGDWRRQDTSRNGLMHPRQVPPFVGGDRYNASSFFATKASDFNLFPRKERDHKSRYRPDNRSMEIDSEGEHSNLTRLRSKAFWELHRSVAESGEGLVRRMRDYENSRSRANAYTKAKEAEKRGRKRSLVLSSRKPKHSHFDSDDEDDEEDVQIFAGELPRVSLPGYPCPPKRTMSLDMKDLDEYELSDSPNGRCSSPIPTWNSNPSIYTHASTQYASIPPILSSTIPPPPRHGSSTSRTDKAIAALSLALANGAGGITDYGSVLANESWASGDVGELWD
ncbi:hypothetical protein H0H93_002828 [Arthromyces matolae]|nr:hypothetical protein H0H93_002828 [Arthromyces matolae]